MSNPADISQRVVRRHLADAMRQVAEAYLRCPDPPDVDGESWQVLEAEIDVAFAAGDHNLAVTAMRAWEQFACEALGVDRDG